MHQDIAELLKYKFAHFEDPYELFPIFADLAIQGIQGKEAALALTTRKWDIANKDIVEYLLDSEVVYESSPPKSGKLRDLLKRSASGIVAGIPLGYIEHQATGYPLLLTIVVSIVAVGATANTSKALGVIMIGAAEGVSEGLRNGLSKIVENWLSPPGKGKAKKEK
jgi:hypothetical protein